VGVLPSSTVLSCTSSLHPCTSRVHPCTPSLRCLSTTPSLATVIVKRVYKPPLKTIPGVPALETPQHIVDRAIVNADDDRWLVYEVEEKHQPHHSVKLILLRNVDDYGIKGQVVSVLFHEAHTKLLLPGFAVYHNADTVEEHKDILLPEEQRFHSSEAARQFAIYFSKRTFDICMSSTNAWTIEKWHVRASLRKHRVWAGEEQIEIPGGQVSGPDPALENKEFIAVLTINKHEKLKIRCRLHHLGQEGEAPKLKQWFFKAAEPVWEHERQDLLDMNRAPPNKEQRADASLAEELRAYELWRQAREERIG